MHGAKLRITNQIKSLYFKRRKAFRNFNLGYATKVFFTESKTKSIAQFDAEKKSRVEEALKYEIFEIKQKFLREIPHPKLILKQIRLLETKARLNQPLTVEDLHLANIPNQQELTVFLENYITETLRLKKDIANASDPNQLKTELVGLYQSQIQFLQKVASYLPQKPIYPDEEIKMSDPIDAYQFLKRIQLLNLQENGINTYLCKEIENANKTTFDIITISCLRAQKILRHV